MSFKKDVLSPAAKNHAIGKLPIEMQHAYHSAMTKTQRWLADPEHYRLKFKPHEQQAIEIVDFAFDEARSRVRKLGLTVARDHSRRRTHR